jgi:hypothetical protein
MRPAYSRRWRGALSYAAIVTALREAGKLAQREAARESDG